MNKEIGMIKRLDFIQKQLDGMFSGCCPEHLVNDDQAIHTKIGQIWETTIELQRALTTPHIIDGYRADAVAQIIRVGELIGEMGLQPDHRQLLSIGMATEMAAEKVRNYRELVGAAASVMLATGERTLAQEVVA